MPIAGPIPTGLFHFDAYRIESLGEAEELDMDNLLSQGPLVIEWPEPVEPILPTERLWAWMEYKSEEHRAMRFAACGKRYETLLTFSTETFTEGINAAGD